MANFWQMQLSLDRWYRAVTASGQTVTSIPRFFYLNWSEALWGRRPAAVWCREPPLDDPAGPQAASTSRWSASVEWKDRHLELTLVASLDPADPTYQIPVEDTYTNAAYLKSHLQKAIRRSRADLALMTFRHFYSLDHIQCLRRLAVIMVEDVRLHEQLSTLVWLTAAVSKGYRLTNSQMCWLYGLVYWMATELQKDDLSDQGPSARAPKELTNADLAALPDEWQHLVLSLMLRKSYGGMSGDQAMFGACIQVWHARLTSLTGPVPARAPIRLVSPPRQRLPVGSWLLAAVDFHCVPNMLNSLQDKFDDLTEAQIKGAIWHCSSKYTNKEPAGSATTSDPLYEQFLPVWLRIRRECRGLARFYLTHNY